MKSLFYRKPSKPTKQCLSLLLESQYWPLGNLEEYQLVKLKKLLKHAASNIPFYQKRFADAGFSPAEMIGVSDIEKIPLLTKKEIQDNFENMVNPKLDKKELELNSTGGSTGMPLNFYQDSDYKHWADAARERAWKYMVGYSTGEIEGVLWGAVRDIGKKHNVFQKLKTLCRESNVVLNTFDLDEKPLRNWIQWYNIIKPNILRGYASSLIHLAQFVERNKLQIHRATSIVSTTEVLYPHMRELVEKILGGKVFDSYGCREVSQIATECSEHMGFHIVMENQYVELVDQKIVVTNLNNFAMPLIRYEVGDLAEHIDIKQCKCGRSSPRITKLMGRDNENIELPSGKVINGEFFEFLFFGYKSVEQYQIVYHKKSQKMDVMLKLKFPGENVEGMVIEEMVKKFNFKDISILHVDQFRKTPTGKLRFVYQIED